MPTAWSLFIKTRKVPRRLPFCVVGFFHFDRDLFVKSTILLGSTMYDRAQARGIKGQGDVIVAVSKN